MTRILIFLVLFSSFSSMSATACTSGNNEVHLLDLLISPHKYANKLITVFGYVCLGDGGPGIYISQQSCNQGQENLGIGLTGLAPQFIVTRESHGFPGYGYVTGRFHALNANQVPTDAGFQTGFIEVENIQSKAIPAAIMYPVSGTINPDSPLFKSISQYFEDWIIAVKNMKYDEIISGFSPGSKMVRAALVKSLHSHSSRLSWVLFNSVNSVAKSFSSVSPFRGIDVFSSDKHWGNQGSKYIVCACTKSGCPSFPSTISYLLKGGHRFCAEIHKEKSKLSISVGRLIY